MTHLTRRAAVAGMVVTGCGLVVPARAVSTLQVTKDPNCGCCAAWIDHMKGAGFSVSVTESAQLNRLKAQLGIPNPLWSCHTGQIDGYVIEGHVPASAVTRLLGQRPDARGLAVPGMPVGSPGMEVAGTPDDEYEVILFGGFGQRRFARFRGSEEL